MAKFNGLLYTALAVVLMVLGSEFSRAVDVLILAATVWFAADWVVQKLGADRP